MKIKFLSLIFMLLCMKFLSAQTITITPVSANCPGQGSVTVSVSDIVNPFFQLKNSLGVNIGSGNTTGTFLALDAGDYLVQVSGEGGVNELRPFTILGEYDPIPTPTISVSDLCDDTFTLGGELSITMPTDPTGKTYEYKVLKTFDSNFPDSLGVYQSVDTPTAITEHGTYQVRIKDECGEILTIQHDIFPSLPTISHMSFNLSNNQSCSSGLVEINGINFYTINGSAVGISNYVAAGGVKVEMWERPDSGSCPTTVPASEPIYTGIITSSAGYIVPLPDTKNYIIRITTPCGESRVSCFDATNGSTPNMEIGTLNEGCDGSETISIKGSSHRFLNYPVNIEVINSMGVITYSTVTANYSQTNNWEALGLPLDDYTVTYTDTCGTVLTENVVNPQSILTPPTVPLDYTKYRCFDDDSGSLTVTGATQIAATISGYIPNRQNATVTIVAGPSNVGVVGPLHNNSFYVWTNVLPGNYTIEIDTGCDGEPVYIDFVVDPSPWQVLNQSLGSIGESFCSGGGSIASDIIYTGAFSYVIQLLDEEGNVIEENTSGSFSNLPSGTYNTRMLISACGSLTYTVENSGSPIIITDDETGPIIAKKLGIICEDEFGMPTSTGTAYFEIAGASPILVEYKKSTESSYTTFSTDAALSFEIENLDANEIYDVRITSCGSSVSTTIALQSPGVMSATNTHNPCVGQPYTLSAPEYIGATYTWKNSLGEIISETREYHIPVYDAAFDGTYSAEINWGDCVVRFFNLVLDSNKCNEPIEDYCVKPGIMDAPTGFTNIGISTVSPPRATWPQDIPNGFLSLESPTKGMVITRVESDSKITEPLEGMLIYDNTAQCVKLYDGLTWNCIKRGCND